MSSDLFLDADLKGLVYYHLGSKATATVAAASMELPALQMERIETDTEELAKTIHRVHPAYSRRSKLRPVGLYLFEHPVLQFIPEEGIFDIKEQLITSLFSHLHRTRVWTVHTYCQNNLSGSRYLAANADVLLNQSTFSELKRYFPRVDTDVAADSRRRILRQEVSGGAGRAGDGVPSLVFAAAGWEPVPCEVWTCWIVNNHLYSVFRDWEAAMRLPGPCVIQEGSAFAGHAASIISTGRRLAISDSFTVELWARPDARTSLPSDSTSGAAGTMRCSAAWGCRLACGPRWEGRRRPSDTWGGTR